MGNKNDGFASHYFLLIDIYVNIHHDI